MTSNTLFRCSFAALLVAMCGYSAAIAANEGQPREMIARANTQYEQGNFAEALETYQSVDEKQPDELRAIALHNAAAAQYRLGDLAAAKDAWVKALHYNDAAFESRVRYNLGNCNYREALIAVQSQDPQAAGGAIPALGKAIEQYRDAIRLNPQNANARANLELAYQLKKQLEEQAQQQEDSQSDQSQDGEKKEQDSQDGKSDKSDQQQENQQNEQQQSEQQQQDQQSQSEQSEDQQQSDQQQRESQQQDGKSDQPQQQSDKEQQAQQSGDEECPLDQPKEGGDNESEQQKPAPQSAEPQEGGQEGKPKEIMLTQEQVDQLLQKVRDNEKERREMLRARMRAKHQPVKQDW